MQRYGSACDQYLLSWEQIRLFFIAANSTRSNAGCIITIYSCGLANARGVLVTMRLIWLRIRDQLTMETKFVELNRVV